MGAPVVLPTAVEFPQGVTFLRSGGVAALLGVKPRRVAQWEANGLITASLITKGGHRRFTAADVAAFLREARPAAGLAPRDIVSCKSWDDGRPVRVSAVMLAPGWGVYVRWQDMGAHQHAREVLVPRTKWVRRLHQGAA